MRLLAQHQLPRPSHRADHDYYTSLQWTADGTCLIASSRQTISSFVLPADLLRPAGEEPPSLQSHATIALPEPTQVVASAPYFALAEPASQLLLAACRDHPLHLYRALADEPSPIASYKLIRRESEAYITPASLLWDAPGETFVCGSANRLDLFDMARPGSDGPFLTVPTIPSRRHISKGNGVGMKGTVAALAGDGGALLAAGTWTRWMGLYDLHRSDRVVANWSVAGADQAVFHVDLGGRGVVQTAWSPCGRYLVVNERAARGLLVYDIRVTGQLLCVLPGRPAPTQQRLRCDLYPSDSGFEVWAGCHDGSVAVWEAVGTRNDVLRPSWTWEAHQAPVGSAVVHPSGSVVATCSGAWDHPSVDDLDESPLLRGEKSFNTRVLEESSVKVWSIGATSPTAPDPPQSIQESS